ncbi:hypothetical protein [Streptomyces sp. HB132]|uniref:hypothetical protein n=1 Tax=Streptomyces sp. HB132 TaxID=767388 RepID=UPI001DB1B1FB|nr:hypothetical protein [Streptomyces sp. HB132]MBM7440494.1 hypothetical protein [Streptomyces sp. HB132]
MAHRRPRRHLPVIIPAAVLVEVIHRRIDDALAGTLARLRVEPVAQALAQSARTSPRRWRGSIIATRQT